MCVCVCVALSQRCATLGQRFPSRIAACAAETQGVGAQGADAWHSTPCYLRLFVTQCVHQVKRCSALTADGVDRVWAVCTNFFTTMTENGEVW